MKMKHAIPSCMMLLFGLLPANSAFAVQWPVYLEGSATVRNVVYESFMHPG